MNNTTIVFPEEVYSKYYNSAGNLVWVGVHSGEHLVRLEPIILQKEKNKMSDLIERQAAIDVLREAYWDKNIQSAKDDPCIVDAMTDWAIRQIKVLPSTQPERKKGKWINGTCNQCGSHAPYWPMASTYYRSNFCPNCGADLRGEKDG